jgi:phosphoglycerol transferase MdoB-like AlkP superfamily enzyme
MKTIKLLTIVSILVASLLLLCLTNIVLADETHEHEHKFEFSLFSLIRPLGICALVAVSVTFITGLFRKKLGRRFLKVHKTFAWLAIAFALGHGILVLVLL